MGVSKSFTAIALLALIASLSSAAARVQSSDAACREVRKACRDAGFKPGHGLKRDCFDPIVQGSPQPGGQGNPLPKVDEKWVRACRAATGGGAAPASGSAPSRPAQSIRADAIVTGPGHITPSNGDSGATVYDSLHKVFWLQDANLAAGADGQAIAQTMHVRGVAPNGMMSYATAVLWVDAVNKYNHGHGYLGHNNWRLPDTPFKDPSCGWMGPGGASFGGLCQDDELGNLYYANLGKMIPGNVAQGFDAKIAPFEHLQIAYYWTSAPFGHAGIKVFSFASGQGDPTTTMDSFYYVLPMVLKASGPIGGKADAPTCGANSDLAVYQNGPAAKKAVYQCSTGISWPVDANLAATHPFQLTGDMPNGLRESRPYPASGNSIHVKPVPLIVGGAMLEKTATQWIGQLNAGAGYLQEKHWKLPDSVPEFLALYTALKLKTGDRRLMATGNAGPFQNLQPFFYWETCKPDPKGQGETSPDCDVGNAPRGKQGTQMDFDFTFGYGLEGTDAADLNYFVTLNYPAPAPPPQCTTPLSCCIAHGGQWSNGRCQ
jgi:hypothetical protein